MATIWQYFQLENYKNLKVKELYVPTIWHLAHLATWRYKQSSLTGVFGSQIWGGNIILFLIAFMRSIHKKYCNKYKSPNMRKYFDNNWEIYLQWIKNESKTKSQTLVIAIGAWISPKCDWYFMHLQIQRIVWNGDTWQYQTKLVSKIHNFSKLGSIFHFYSLIFRVSPW